MDFLWMAQDWHNHLICRVWLKDLVLNVCSKTTVLHDYPVKSIVLHGSLIDNMCFLVYVKEFGESIYR